jgi:hypothetical protein
MSDSAHRARADQRRRQAIMWTVVGAIVVIALVLLAFCAGTGGDPESQITPPAQTTRSAPVTSVPGSGQPVTSAPGGQGVTSAPGSKVPGGQGATSAPGGNPGGNPAGNSGGNPGGSSGANPGGNPDGQPISSGPGGSPGAPASVSAKASTGSSPATPRTKSPTPVAPRGGADTGGGSSLTGESTIFIGLGVVTLLAAMAAAVLATRPRRRIEP